MIRSWGLPILSALTLALGPATTTANAEVNKPQEVAPGVWFHEGDIGRKGHCNNGWIVFQDYVLVIDANFPSGAREILPKIKASTDRPIRFAFDTHHHGDHAYGNKVWTDLGATVVAHEGVLAEMKKYETGHFGTTPGRWEDTAKGRDDVRDSKLVPPSLLFPKKMVFDNGAQRVELHWFGVAHTHGDGFAWLPKERILFTGDACVNGPYNYMGDGSSRDWIPTLEAARALDPKIVCPGHGLLGGVEILDHQIAFFRELQSGVGKLLSAGKTPAEAKASIETLRTELSKNDKIAIYLGGMFASQVEKVWTDLGGKPFDTKQASAPASAPGGPRSRVPDRDDEVLTVVGSPRRP
jgi:glyoxylase-like metal-dependent hydrolase (beta-lactamase superfamily II)